MRKNPHVTISLQSFIKCLLFPLDSYRKRALCHSITSKKRHRRITKPYLALLFKTLI